MKSTHTHNMTFFDLWVAVWWPGFATLLPSNRKPSGSNFFLILFTVWNLGLLLFLLFIIWVIFPDISFKQRNITSSPSRPITSITNLNCHNQFKMQWNVGQRGDRHKPIWSGIDRWSDQLDLITWLTESTLILSRCHRHNDKQMKILYKLNNAAIKKALKGMWWYIRNKWKKRCH